MTEEVTEQRRFIVFESSGSAALWVEAQGPRAAAATAMEQHDFESVYVFEASRATRYTQTLGAERVR